MLLAVADESDLQLNIDCAVALTGPGQVRERFGVLLGIWIAGEGFECFHWDDPIADACAEAFGVEGAL